MDIGCASDSQNFVYCGLDNFPRINAGGNLAVLGASERGDGIQRAIPDQLGPELALNVLGNSAGHVCSRKERRNSFCFFAPRSYHKDPAPDVLHPARFRHRGADVNDRRKSLNRSRSPDLFHIVDTVLQAQDQGIRSKQWGQRAGCRCVVRRLHRKKDNFRASNRVKVRGGFYAHALLKLQSIKEQSILFHRLDKGGAPDHHDRRTRTRQQPAEVSAHRAGANDGNFGPTLMSRSMSRSVLYRWGETRMFPSRKLTTTFSFRRSW